MNLPVSYPLPDSGRLAHSDFVKGLCAWRLWMGLGLRDIRIRYQRTRLGPWWITLGTTATFTALGMLFSAVLKNDVRLYLPYLAAGMVSWNLIAAMGAEAPRIFLDSRHIINSVRLPLVVHVLRCLVRNTAIFLHNCTAALAALLILGGSLTWAHLLLLATLPIVLAALFSGALVLGLLGARFRDLEPIIGISVQMAFFMTPIMWSPSDIPMGSKWWVTANPLYHMVEVVRAPLLGVVPESASLVFAAITSATLLATAYLLFRLLRRRIAYWL